ncbi:TIGR02285 family protein [Desulfoprunum benzoelyticum]|uniref:Uncharacterized protein (TIGR02285 family) n=1 Tax=Desulfoprunum benzoelyticum TaxID=1506996 RepID=A0A840V786_9BACT|nr:TIGR02285 family protein [Desulfoprunum benzoelyticum]MBB5349619.1 uncharacterized protein (TIGR02285 family) [Desulfoprunum benzoelyticum]MBM9531600.1 TIGR02285 family protein [Desulfoprunum benzoelyticum]
MSLSSRHLNTFFVIAIAILCSSQPSSAKDSIRWLEAPAPPFFIHEGQYKGQGYEDLVTDIITENLPQYSHSRTIASITRHYYEFEQGNKVCNVGLYKTPEREKFMHFSIPSFFTYPSVLIIDKSKWPSFGNAKKLKLQDILKSKQLIIGRGENRSYGRFVDEVLNRYGTQQNIFAFEGQELSLHFFEMLKLNRLDGLIGLLEEAMYQAERLGIRDQIMTIDIEENQGNRESWLSYVACSKTEWGRKVIDDINHVLIKQRPSPRYRAAYERWLDPSSHEGYRKLYEKVFLSVTR